MSASPRESTAGQKIPIFFALAVAWRSCCGNARHIFDNIRHDEQESLVKLMNEADLFAKHAMQKSGGMPATLRFFVIRSKVAKDQAVAVLPANPQMSRFSF